MTRYIVALIALALLVGCSGGGGDSSTTSSSPPPATPTAQPDMLVATNDGLWRGKANGQGGVVFARPNFNRENLSFSGTHVFYQRTKGPIAGTFFEDTDIWTVNPDGTGDRAAVNTTNPEILRGSQGPWAVYLKTLLRPDDTFDQEMWSVHDNGAQHLLLQENMAITVQFHGTDRVLFMTDRVISSNTPTGTDYVIHAEIPLTNGDAFMAGMRVVGNRLIFLQEFGAGGAMFRILTVPLAGGTPTPLESDQFDSHVVGALGNRVIYHRCAPPELCDVVSIEADGTNPVVLTSHPANEAAQGVTTNQVIIRRNLSGDDQLIAVPVAGGGERVLMTMTNSEFVELVTGDLIIVRRPSGTWSLDLNGALKQLGTVALDFNVTAVGNAVCGNTRNAVWCMPLDGSGPQVKIADEGKVVGVL